MKETSEQDYVLCSPAPDDAVSKIEFLNDTDKLIVSSWDSTIRLYNASSGEMISKKQLNRQPILCMSLFNSQNVPASNSLFICGGLSREVLLGDLNDEDTSLTVLGEHAAPVRCCETNAFDMVFTGSWDKTVKCWDKRTKSCVDTILLPGKVFGLAVSDEIENNCYKLVICDSTKTVSIYDSRNLSSPESVRDSSLPVLKSQLRAVQCFPDNTGYAVTSVEGRVAWEFFDVSLGPNGKKKNYAFKCHRDKGGSDGREVVYPVNVLTFHKTYQSFATGGGDGAVIIWDGYNKKRLWRTPTFFDGSISALAFHAVEPKIAIGVSDGKKELARPKISGIVAVRSLLPEEVTPKTKPQ